MVGLEKVLAEEWQIAPLRETIQAASAITVEEVLAKVLAAADAAFEAKVAQIGGENFTQFETWSCCRALTPTGGSI